MKAIQTRYLRGGKDQSQRYDGERRPEYAPVLDACQALVVSPELPVRRAFVRLLLAGVRYRGLLTFASQNINKIRFECKTFPKGITYVQEL